MLAEALRSDYEISVVLDGKTALDLAGRTPPDLILLDIQMPEMDGYEVCRRLKADSRTCDIPVIFVTARDDARDETRGFELGAVDYITKPFSMPVVQARIRNQLQLAAAKRQIQTLNADLERRVEERTADLGAATQRAESASRVKSNFLASISHELRTPLNAILGFSDALICGVFEPLNGRPLEYVKDIHDSGRHLLAMVNDLLDITVAETGHLHLSEEVVDLAALATTATHMLEHRAVKADVALAVTCELKEVVVIGDHTRLLQSLLNVIGNAIKYNKPGGWVHLGIQMDDGGGCTLTVTDGGIGMTAEEVTLALVPFGRSHEAAVSNIEGNGLGLPLSAAIIAAHGGALSVDAIKNVGTCVTMRLPMERSIRMLAIA
ncbi:MAG: response regulator [Alphaproteobacteria bacterium]